MSDQLDRRQFLRTAATTGVGVGLAAKELAGRPAFADMAATGTIAAPPLDVVRMGFVGVGHQGTSHVSNFLKIDGVEIRVICDLLPEHAQRAAKMVTDAGKPAPAILTGPEAYRALAQRDDVDLVFNATRWELHAPVLLAALKGGKHAATEVPLSISIEESWALVEASEKAQKHCVMMENCCYDRTEMMILNMIRQGQFGELLHAECGYLHDLRRLKLTDFYVNRWRVKHSITRNGDLYPTHGVGPVAQWMNVNRGNQFDYLVAMSGPSRGLNLWAAEHIGPESAEARQRYALGDVVNTLVRTKSGQTILVTHDTDSPRPYSRRMLLQGTKGVVQKYPAPARIHVEGRSRAHQWDAFADYQKEFEHPVWQALEERSKGAGHGGMDYIEDYRLIQCLRAGTPTDMDVYDGAAWSAVGFLSEKSVASRSRPVDFPDFTRGAWVKRPALGIVRI